MKALGAAIRVCVLILSPCLVAGCRHTRVANSVPPGSLAGPAIQNQNADSIALVFVPKSPGESLERGRPVEIIVSLQYTLATRDNAILRLSLDQFSNRESCVPSAESNGSPAFLNPAERVIPVTRGTHKLEIPITWPGDTGDGTNGRIFGSGTLSFHASLGIERPDYEFLTRRFGTEYCMRF